MFDKLFKILIISSIVLIVSAFFVYKGYHKVQITDRSIEKLTRINEQLTRLASLPKVKYSNRDSLIFEVNKLIDYVSYPQIVNYIHESAKYHSNRLYKFDLSKLKEKYSISNDLLETKYKIFVSKDFSVCLNELDSIRDFARNGIATDVIVSYDDVYYTLPSIDSLLISDDVYSKIKRIANRSFDSHSEIEQSMIENLGVNVYRKYEILIADSFDYKAYWQRVLYVIAFLSIVMLSAIYLYQTIAEYNEKARKEQSDIALDLQDAKTKIDASPNKASYRWDYATLTLQNYFSKNLSQIDGIFKVSIGVMIVGFCIVVFILWMSMYQPGKIQNEVVGLITGVITEAIGALLMLVYKSTVTQALSYTKNLERTNNVGMAFAIIESVEINDNNAEKISDAKIEISKRLIGNDA